MPDSVYEITTPAFERTANDSWGRVPGERRPLNRKSTTATNRQTGISYAASSSVHRLPIATAVPYANLGAETRNDDVISGELAWNGSDASLSTIVGLATVSVLAFWLVVTVIVLSCLLARRTATTTSVKQPSGCRRSVELFGREPADRPARQGTRARRRIGCSEMELSRRDVDVLRRRTTTDVIGRRPTTSADRPTGHTRPSRHLGRTGSHVVLRRMRPTDGIVAAADGTNERQSTTTTGDVTAAVPKDGSVVPTPRIAFTIIH